MALYAAGPCFWLRGLPWEGFRNAWFCSRSERVLFWQSGGRNGTPSGKQLNIPYQLKACVREIGLHVIAEIGIPPCFVLLQNSGLRDMSSFWT